MIRRKKPIRSIRGQYGSLRKRMKQDWVLRKRYSKEERKMIEDIAEKKYRQGKIVTGIETGDDPDQSRGSRRTYTELDEIRREMKEKGFSKKDSRRAHKRLFNILNPEQPSKLEKHHQKLQALRNNPEANLTGKNKTLQGSTNFGADASFNPDDYGPDRVDPNDMADLDQYDDFNDQLRDDFDPSRDTSIDPSDREELF